MQRRCRGDAEAEAGRARAEAGLKSTILVVSCFTQRSASLRLANADLLLAMAKCGGGDREKGNAIV